MDNENFAVSVSRDADTPAVSVTFGASGSGLYTVSYNIPSYITSGNNVYNVGECSLRPLQGLSLFADAFSFSLPLTCRQL